MLDTIVVNIAEAERLNIKPLLAETEIRSRHALPTRSREAVSCAGCGHPTRRSVGICANCCRRLRVCFCSICGKKANPFWGLCGPCKSTTRPCPQCGEPSVPWGSAYCLKHKKRREYQRLPLVRASLTHLPKPSGPCEHCGNQATVRHHPDYDNPFQVVFLCYRCHSKEHGFRRKTVAETGL